MTTLLQRAIDMAQKGQREEAEEQLRQVLAQQPHNEVAWIWLSAVARDVAVKQEALQHVLAINPDNQLAQKGLRHFGKGPIKASTLASRAVDEPPAASADIAAGSSETVSPIDISVQGKASEPLAAFDFDVAPELAEPTASPPGIVPDETPVFDFDFGADDADFAAEQPDLSILGGFDLEEPSATDFDFDFNFDDTASTPASTVDIPAQPKSSLPSPSLSSEPELASVAGQPETVEGTDWGLSPDFFDEADVETNIETSIETDVETKPFVLEVADENLLDDIFTESRPMIDSDILEELIVHTGPSAKKNKEGEVEWAVLPEQAEILDDSKKKTEEALPAEDDLARALQRKGKEDRRLIIGTAIFIISIFICSALFYYLIDVADKYAIFPQLVGTELRIEAPRPKDGVSVLKFKGYPASRVKVEWTEDTGVETCKGATGLAVDFMNGDPPSRFNNRVCSEGVCIFEKEITPGPIGKVTVTYICGKSAAVTLYK